jgi:hypothetical protein
MHARIVDTARPGIGVRRRLALSLLITVLATLAVPALAAGARAATPETAVSSDPAQWRATINGHDVSTSDANAPVPLRAGRDAQVVLSVTNPGPDSVTIRTLRLEGRVIGMSFFAFSTRIDLVVPGGSTQQRNIQLDLSDLGDQAVGLIPARLSLLAPDRTVIEQRSVTTDVRGSLRSAYGIFGLAVGCITLVLVLSLALEIARHQLPRNRWRRAVRFLAPGVGVGLTATFTLSATRILTPSAGVWVPLVVGCGVAGFILGYLTPTPVDEDEYDDYQFEESPRAAVGSGQFPHLLDVREAPAPALESDAWTRSHGQTP